MESYVNFDIHFNKFILHYDDRYIPNGPLNFGVTLNNLPHNPALNDHEEGV